MLVVEEWAVRERRVVRMVRSDFMGRLDSREAKGLSNIRGKITMVGMSIGVILGGSLQGVARSIPANTLSRKALKRLFLPKSKRRRKPTRREREYLAGIPDFPLG